MKKNLINSATIRNAKLCKENENLAHYTVFDRERDLKGWDFIQGASLYGVSGGFMFLNAAIPELAISRTQPLISFDSSAYSQITIRYKYVKNRSGSIASKGKIQFTTTADIAFNDDKSVEFNIISDGKWRNYTIDMNPVETWVGLINNLKIFLTTDGAKDDEIFIEFIKIQAPTFSFCSDECEVQEETTRYASNFLLSQINTPPNEFSLINTDLNRTITVQNNPTIAKDASLALSNTSTVLPGPRAVFSFLEGASRGYLSFRIYPAQGQSSVKLLTNTLLNQVGFEIIFDSDNIIKYRATSTLISEFEVSFSYQYNEWYDIFVSYDVASSLYSVSINNELVDDKIPAVFGGALKGLSIENLNADSLYYFDDFIVVEILNSTVCTGIGKQGYIQGSQVNLIKLDIIKDFNDTLIININNFGDVNIKLPTGLGLPLETVRNYIQKRLTNLDVGGYSRATVILANRIFTIRSGTYGFDSTVSISPTTLSSQLGFDDFIQEIGRPHAAGFEFTNTFKEKSFLLEGLKKEEESRDISSYFIQNPKLYEVEIGAPYAESVTRRVTLDGVAKTFVDFTNRATNEGPITEIFFHGILPKSPAVKAVGNDGFANGTSFVALNTILEDLEIDSGYTLRITTSGYIGAGDYVITRANGNTLVLEDEVTLPFATNLEYEIFNVAKVKHFRLRKDGTLLLINEQAIGVEQDNRLYSQNPDSYRIPVDWYLHKGDLIGIYNAVSLYAGANDIDVKEFTYLEVQGEVTESIDASIVPQGDNIYGIGLYGKSSRTQNRGALDIELEVDSAAEYLEITGRQLPEKRFYNLLTAVGTGVSFKANVSGTHVHLVENLLNSDILSIVHDNIAYNVNTLYDGKKYASNGLVGDFEQDSPDSSYFYISGDAEWGNTVEFPVPGGNLSLIETSDFEEDPYSLEMSWNSPKEISRFKMYFKEFPHAEGYFLEYRKSGNNSGDGTSNDFFLIGLNKEIEFTKVKLDKTTLTDTAFDIEAALYRHFLPVYDGYVSSTNKATIGPYQFYRRFPYNVLDKEFTPIKTTAFKWNCLFHKSTKISEVELYSITDIDARLEDVIEVFFAGDDKLFFKAEPEVVDLEKVRYNFNKPIRFIRIVTSPAATLELDSIYVKPVDDLIQYKNKFNTCVDAIDINPVQSGESEVFELEIYNNTCKTADLEIDIATDTLNDLIVLKSSLNTEESIIEPEIGPPGILYKDSNANLYVTDNIALNAKTFGLKNLAAFKKVYESIVYKTESDSFVTIDGSKWEILYNQDNYPQLPVRTVNPGFRIEADVINYPSNPLRATLKTKWYITGEFNIRVVAEVNSNLSNASEMGSFVGIIDSSGRRVFIESVRTFFTGSFTAPRVKFSFRVVDTDIGVLSEKILYGIGSFGVPNIGENPDQVPYFMNVQRVYNPAGAIDLLRFSYLDTVNDDGTGNLKWDEDEYFELNTNSLGLDGQLKIITGNYWTSSQLFAVAHPLGGIPYAEITHFFFGGNSSYTGRNIAFNPSYFISGANGEINVTNEVNTGQTTKAVAIDLDTTARLDIFEMYTNSGSPLWDKTRIQFSNTNVDNPDLVDWGNTTWLNARWVLFEETAVPDGGPGVLNLEALRVYPDITAPATKSFAWDYLGNVLSDNDPTSFINQVDYPIIAIALSEKFNIGNYQLLNKTFNEFQAGSNPYNSWGGNSFFSLSDSNTDNLNVINWNSWVFYEESTKQIRPFKWIAFKNEQFNALSGLNSNKIFASEFRASTLDISSEGTNNYLDRVDFTEYPEWFDTISTELINIAEVTDDDKNFEGILFGATSGFDSLFLAETRTLAIFDDKEDTYGTMAGASGYMWRLFGTVSGEEIIVTEELIDENGNKFILEQTEIINNFNFQIEDIYGFELVLADSTQSIPNTIIFQTLTGVDPNLDSSWQDFYTETDLVTEISQTQGLEYSFNLGNPYIVYFDDSIAVSGVRLLITDSQSQSPELSSISISSFRVYQRPPTYTPSLGLASDTTARVGGRRSLKITYPVAESGLSSVAGAFTIKPDPLWSFQDYLSFYLKTDSSNIDWPNCYLRIGTNSQQYYEWSLSGLSAQSLNEFTLIKLKFKEAQNQSNGDFDLITPSVTDLEPLVNFNEGPIEYFELFIKPITTTTEEVNIWIDNFQIIREDFNIPGRYSNTLYLNNSELIHFPISNVSLRQGYIEMIITPDWNNSGLTTFKREEAFTIFSIVNNFDESLSLYYHGRFGLRLSYTDNDEQNFSYDVGYLDSIEPFKPFKLGMLWNSTGKQFDGRSNANIRFYFNDNPFIDFSNPWFTNESKNNILVLGGKAPLSNVSFNAAEFYEGVVGTYLQADVRSITGGVENLLFSNIPVKSSFDLLESIRDFIYLSKDGINFFSVSSLDTPFMYSDVPHGSKVKVYLKIDFPKNKSNLSRESFLISRWKLK